MMGEVAEERIADGAACKTPNAISTNEFVMVMTGVDCLQRQRVSLLKHHHVALARGPSGRFVNFDVDVGRGVAGTGTPYAGFGTSDTERRCRLGWRLTRPADPGAFTFSLEASRRESADDNAPEHGVGFRATARW